VSKNITVLCKFLNTCPCGNLPHSNTQSLLLRSASSNSYSFGQTILTPKTTQQNAVFIHHGAWQPQPMIAVFGYKYEGCKHATVSHGSAPIPATSEHQLGPACCHLAQLHQRSAQFGSIGPSASLATRALSACRTRPTATSKLRSTG
jgi:hypothetical protein